MFSGRQPAKKACQLGKPGQLLQAVIRQGKIQSHVHHTVAVQPVCHHFHAFAVLKNSFCPLRRDISVLLAQSRQGHQRFGTVRRILPLGNFPDQPVIFCRFLGCPC